MSKSNRRKYSDREKGLYLAALQANGGNVARTARECGVPRDTFVRWAKGQTLSGDVPALQQSQKADLIAKLDEITWALVESLAEKIPSATLQQAATTMAIAIDKRRLLADQSTANINYQQLATDIEAELVRLGVGVTVAEEPAEVERTALPAVAEAVCAPAAPNVPTSGCFVTAEAQEVGAEPAIPEAVPEAVAPAEERVIDFATYRGFDARIN